MAVYELTVSGGRRCRIRRNARGEWHVSMSMRVPYAPRWLRFRTLTDASKAARLALTVSEAPVLERG